MTDWEMVYRLIRYHKVVGDYVLVPHDVYTWLTEDKNEQSKD